MQLKQPDLAAGLKQQTTSAALVTFRPPEIAVAGTQQQRSKHNSRLNWPAALLKAPLPARQPAILTAEGPAPFIAPA